MIISKNCTRIPLVRKPDGTPFVWHDIAKSRIEFRHGQKVTYLQLEKDTPVIASRDIPVPDIDNNAVASWIGSPGPGEWDIIIIKHSKYITCLSIPKGTRFQVQHQINNAV